jgi:acyl-coenzyme A thioesterase PaaI-like protein
VTDRQLAQQVAVDRLLALLRHERRGDLWVGQTPDLYGPVVFGGMALALTISAACADTPAGTRLHSLHGHFLRPVQGGREVVFHNEVMKAGRTFSLHVTTASQDEKPVMTMTCSFTKDTAGYVYDLSGSRLGSRAARRSGTSALAAVSQNDGLPTESTSPRTPGRWTPSRECGEVEHA